MRFSLAKCEGVIYYKDMENNIERYKATTGENRGLVNAGGTWQAKQMIGTVLDLGNGEAMKLDRIEKRHNGGSTRIVVTGRVEVK